MSRSYRKHPFEKFSDSDKADKQDANRKFRRKNKQKYYEDEDTYLYSKTREISNNENWKTDGIKLYSPERPEVKRK